MSYANSKITMRSGDVHFATETSSVVAKIVEVGRAGNKALVSFEAPTIPAGELFYVDPNEVASITAVR